MIEIKSLVLFGWLMVPLMGYGFANSLKQPADTVKKATLVVTPRLNSTGHFPFTGSLVNYHINADINIFYERKVLGFFLFKSQDLQEPSIINYLQPGLFANIRVNPALRARVFIGYLLSQVESFRDNDSDFYSALGLYWDIVPGLRVENTALFYDMEQQVKLADRLLITWQEKKFKVDLYLWHRIVFENRNHATSAMLSFTFPQLKLSKSTTLIFTSSYQRYLTTNRPGFALKEGYLFSLAVPIEIL